MTSADLLPFMTEDERNTILTIEQAPEPLWSPDPANGPQQMAFASTADVIGYGGAAGGGKTETAIGLALMKHKRTLFLRRSYKELLAINDRLGTILGSRDGHSGIDKVWRPPSVPGVSIEYGSIEHAGNPEAGPSDEQGYQGRPHDLLVFDEAAQFSEFTVRFLASWIRSEDSLQHCQLFLPMNPPMDPAGEWVFEFFGPWLDDKHPNPAVSGELRWFVRSPVTDEELEVSGPEPVSFPDAADLKDRIAYPKSRTFIFSRVEDNSYYANSGYKAQLQSMPEPFRSRLLKGLFKRNLTDDPFQVIPAEWLDAAMARWTKPARLGAIESVGVDVARGGKDNTVIADRHEGNWYGELESHPGKTTPNGPAAAGLVAINVGRHRPPIHVDVIGVGASCYDSLVAGGVHQVLAVNVAEKATGPDRTGTLQFGNQRAQMVWRLRDQLDPAANTGIALPPDPLLRQELLAYRWFQKGTAIWLEDTDDIKERIGRSPDRATAVCLAAIPTPRLADFQSSPAQIRRDYDPIEASMRAQQSMNARRQYDPRDRRD